MEDRTNMTREQVLRWMLHFGTGPTKVFTLKGTWADVELAWEYCAENGWLERMVGGGGVSYKLSPKALESLNE